MLGCEEMKKEISCGAIIISEGKVLVVKQKNSGNYGFPKGHKMESESDVETAIRETKEETNLDISIDQNRKYQISFEQEVRGEKIIKTLVLFRVSLTENPFQIKNQEKEISNIEWVNIRDVYNKLTYDNLKELWLKALKDLEED